ncbi:Uncharacterised protein [Halioglobus japonicus]|nr:Uncharacterised protein [Halioglobus japonicus]
MRIMYRLCVSILLPSLFLLVAPASVAVPIQLTQAEFNEQIDDYFAIVETFETTQSGFYSSPFTFANGTIESRIGVAVNSLHPPFCRDMDTCLVQRVIPEEKRFYGFPESTLLWGATMDFVSLSDTFLFNVIGGSGVLTLEFSPETQATFLGFKDVLGISAITVENLGGGSPRSWSNYSFDDITTGSSVAAPPTIWLFCIALLVVMRKRFRHR